MIALSLSSLIVEPQASLGSSPIYPFFTSSSPSYPSFPCSPTSSAVTVSAHFGFQSQRQPESICHFDLVWVRFQLAAATNFRFISTFRGFHKFCSQRFVMESFRHHTQTHLSCGLCVLCFVFPSLCSLTPLILRDPKKGKEYQQLHDLHIPCGQNALIYGITHSTHNKCVETGITYCICG